LTPAILPSLAQTRCLSSGQAAHLTPWAKRFWALCELHQHDGEVQITQEFLDAAEAAGIHTQKELTDALDELIVNRLVQVILDRASVSPRFTCTRVRLLPPPHGTPVKAYTYYESRGALWQ
jgi:hypothetical protein